MLKAVGMDIDALHSALVSLTVCPEQVRSARENLTAANGNGPASLGDFLDSLERDLRVAKATLAGELGFTLCRCCWPPELLATDGNGQAYCPSSPKAAHEDHLVKLKRASISATIDQADTNVITPNRSNSAEQFWRSSFLKNSRLISRKESRLPGPERAFGKSASLECSPNID